MCHQPDTTKQEGFEGTLYQRTSAKYGFNKRCKTTGIKTAVQNTLVR